MPVDIPTLAVLLTAQKNIKQEGFGAMTGPLVQGMIESIINRFDKFSPIIQKVCEMQGTDCTILHYDSVDSVLRGKQPFTEIMSANEFTALIDHKVFDVAARRAEGHVALCLMVQITKGYCEGYGVSLPCSPYTSTHHYNLREELIESIRDEDFSRVCANPVCSRMQKNGVKLWYCRGCRGTHYCSDACQKKDRAEHKKHCNVVKDIIAEINACRAAK